MESEKDILDAEARAIEDPEFQESMAAAQLPPNITAAILVLNRMEAIFAGAFARGAGLNPQVTAALMVLLLFVNLGVLERFFPRSDWTS